MDASFLLDEYRARLRALRRRRSLRGAKNPYLELMTLLIGAPPPSRAGSLLRVQALHRYRRHRPLRLVLRAPALGARSAGRKAPRRVRTGDARRAAGRAARRGREKSKQNPVRI